MELGCPACEAEVEYEDLENDGDDGTRCPSCGVTSPNSEWWDE